MKVGFIKWFIISVLYFVSVDAVSLGVQDAGFQGVKGRVVEALKESWCSREKAELMMDLVFLTRPQVCVEVGVYTGSSVLPVAAALKYLGSGHIYAIDAWSNEVAVKNVGINDPNYWWWWTLNMEQVKYQFISLLDEWALHRYCRVIHAPSERTADQISEIDFLHLDGSMSEEGSLLDVQLFLPKVKSGGYILLSNLFMFVDGKHTKMSSMWRLFDQCEIVAEIDNNNVALFRKM